MNEKFDTTIIISSHILSEMEYLASDIGIMSNGKIIKEKPLKEIYMENKDKIVVRVDDLSRTAIILEERGVQDFKIIDDGQIHIFDLTYDTSYFAELFVQSGLKLYIDVVKKTLEEYFCEVVGRN